ncbi:tRNA (adenine(22)-N(1))-methyltransferase [Peribacillus glennii]|uniref:tRNA (Adenine(22)-N(1))-methyltransferase TrmK n=1 Tax=Peribacillus glennii TaxID=2303991 RepID=A0A372LIB4_9BACI|nr:tRNA (adenine(22)-N(1))-methyltransferase TrmK [Peribacillus glennii]RFU65734.1 tRNA (adenine(22)-N(1))-methyltransferase TrmK [Peribacillus glennii]
MNHEKLSKRLERVAKHIPKNSVLADIGSDHAYLPCYAILSGLASRAIAGEVAEGPYQSAHQQVQQTGLEHVIEVRKGDGLDVISPNESTCITIAGMGGSLISNILERGKEKLHGVKRLILQPNVGASNIRTWLIENGWELINEEILEEDEKIYEILIAEKGNPLRPYQKNRDSGIFLGPFLKEERNGTFRKKWSLEKAHWQKILKQLEEKGQSQDIDGKRAELVKKIQMVEEAIEE